MDRANHLYLKLRDKDIKHMCLCTHTDTCPCVTSILSACSAAPPHQCNNRGFISVGIGLVRYCFVYLSWRFALRGKNN